MRHGLLPTAGLLAFPPLIVFGGLAVLRLIPTGPALLGAAVCGLASFAVAALLAGEIDRLAARLGGAPGRRHPLLPLALPLEAAIDLALRSAQDRQRGMEQRLLAGEAIVMQLPEPLIVLGADRSIVRRNAVAARVFGEDVHALLRHPTLRAAIDRVQFGDGVQTADLSLPVPMARELHVTVIRLPGEATALVLGDHTRARAVERMREDFVANASHELRTPLSSLIGFIDTLRGPAADDPPAQQRFLAIMAEQAARMNRLIDDLLSLSRIELSEHRPPAETLALAPLIRRVAAGMELRIAARSVTLELAIDAALPEVTGDADQLEQVLQNLLVNAIKYGREGGRVIVRAAASVPGAGRFPGRPGVVVAVQDEGSGIAKIHLSRLTERFYRVDKGRSRAAGGTGLGLAIVKHIVNRHRGQLLIESEPGKGSTFSVWLPLAP